MTITTSTNKPFDISQVATYGPAGQESCQKMVDALQNHQLEVSFNEQDKTFVIPNTANLSIETIQKIFAEKIYTGYQPKILDQLAPNGDRIVSLEPIVTQPAIAPSATQTLKVSPQYPYDLQDTHLSQMEFMLNLLGKIPVASSASGSARMSLGTTQVISGSVQPLFCVLTHPFSKSPLTLKSKIAKQISYIGHGWANILRGGIETVPVIGNITTFTYDLLGFRISYPVEKTGIHYEKLL